MTQARALLQGRWLVAVAPAAPASAALEAGPGSREPGRFACSTRRRPRRRPEQSHTRRPAVTAMRHVPRAVRPRSRDRSPIARSGNSRVPAFVCAPCGCPCRNWTDRRGRVSKLSARAPHGICPSWPAHELSELSGRAARPRPRICPGRSPYWPACGGGQARFPGSARGHRIGPVAAAAGLSRLSAHGNCAFRFEWMATNA